MNRSKRIKKILNNQFSDFDIIITDNSHLHKGHNNFTGEKGTHIAIKLNAKTKIKVNRLDIHKKINLLLEEEFNSGLHSLEINITLFD